VAGVPFTGTRTIQPFGPNNQGPINRTADYSVKNNESHMIVDFQVGKDMGLGLLGRDDVSRLGFGVRIAQFTTKSNLTLFADPNPHLSSKYFPPFHRSLPVIGYYQFYKAKPEILRNFRGVGPSLSWNASMPLLGSHESDAEVTFDWGADFAVLFGRQKARIRHQTTGDRHKHDPFGPFHGAPKYSTDHYVNSANVSRSRSVVVSNVGASAGISLQFPNAKVSIGYRADFFFGAMDGGIDARKNENRGFFGPFASISIGVGD